MSINRQMDKQVVCNYAMQYNTVIKRNEVLKPYGQTLKTIILSEVSQDTKATHCMTALCETSSLGNL